MLTKGFTEKCYDEKTFFATDHVSGEKTFSNTSTAALSTESFLAARQAMMSITGDKNKPLKLVPDLLVVSPKNEMVAKKIPGSFPDRRHYQHHPEPGKDQGCH